MNVKSILKEFWATTEGYDGEVTCEKVKDDGKHTFYRVETDGNVFEAMMHNDDPKVVFFHGDGVIGQWRSTLGDGVVELDGIPHLIG